MTHDLARRRRWPSAVGGLVAPAVLVGLALAYPGAAVSQVDLNDGAVWVTKSATKQLARWNAQVGELNAGVVAGQSTFDVLQDGDQVLLTEPGRISLVDPAEVALAASAHRGGRRPGLDGRRGAVGAPGRRRPVGAPAGPAGRAGHHGAARRGARPGRLCGGVRLRRGARHDRRRGAAPARARRHALEPGGRVDAGPDRAGRRRDHGRGHPGHAHRDHAAHAGRSGRARRVGDATWCSSSRGPPPTTSWSPPRARCSRCRWTVARSPRTCPAAPARRPRRSGSAGAGTRHGPRPRRATSSCAAAGRTSSRWRA